MHSSNKRIVFSTGNILSGNKKPGRKSAEELSDSLKLVVQGNDVKGTIKCLVDDLQTKLGEHERNDISIAAKVFLNNGSVDNLDESVTSLLATLNVSYIDNVVLAYHPTPVTVAQSEANGTNNSESFGVLKWGSRNEKSIEELKQLWSKLEEYSEKKKITQLGISDLDTETLTDLYGNSKIQPTIAQINLSSCCVVPPSLQEFCTKNDIQLLTHSDPEIILAEDAFEQLGVQGLRPLWTVRYQIHVKCRGLLTAKGYVVGARKELAAGDS